MRQAGTTGYGNPPHLAEVDVDRIQARPLSQPGVHPGQNLDVGVDQLSRRHAQNVQVTTPRAPVTECDRTRQVDAVADTRESFVQLSQIAIDCISRLSRNGCAHSPDDTGLAPSRLHINQMPRGHGPRSLSRRLPAPTPRRRTDSWNSSEATMPGTTRPGRSSTR